MPTTRLEFLAKPEWEFRILPVPYPKEDFYELWSSRVVSPLPPHDIVSSYALSGLYASSTPAGIDYSHLDPETFGLTLDDCKILQRFIEEPELISQKIIWVELKEKDGLVTHLTFFLRKSDLF